MAHLLIAHPDAHVRLALHAAIEPAGHVAEDTALAVEVVGLVAHAEATSDAFDLILLGGFGAAGTACAATLPAASREHALVGLDETLPGAIGRIDTTSEPALVRAAFEAALGRRQRYLGRVAIWARALKLLDGLAATPGGAQLRLDEQRELIEAGQARVAVTVAAACEDEEAIAKALEDLAAETSKALAGIPLSLAAILGRFGSYQATPSFWIALRQAFAQDRVRCYALLSELERLTKDKLAHGLAHPGGHFVLPIYANHRLYFRWSNGVRVLEDFTPASREAAVLGRLAQAPEAPVPLATGPLPV